MFGSGCFLHEKCRMNYILVEYIVIDRFFSFFGVNFGIDNVARAPSVFVSVYIPLFRSTMFELGEDTYLAEYMRRCWNANALCSCPVFIVDSRHDHDGSHTHTPIHTHKHPCWCVCNTHQHRNTTCHLSKSF